MKKFNWNLAGLLTALTFVGGFVLDAVSKKADDLEREEEFKIMKAELKDEIMEELMSEKS